MGRLRMKEKEKERERGGEIKAIQKCLSYHVPKARFNRR